MRGGWGGIFIIRRTVYPLFYKVLKTKTSFLVCSTAHWYFDFHGPSYSVDTACSSSLVAFSNACDALQRGVCDVALVGGSSVTLHPGVSVAFNRLHMLSPDSACQSFSQHGNGYARSEGVAMMVLVREDCVGKYLADGGEATK